MNKKKQIVWRPVALLDVEDPAFSRKSAHRWLPALRAGRSLLSGKIPDTHFC
jgi:hypothetical protein